MFLFPPHRGAAVALSVLISSADVARLPKHLASCRMCLQGLCKLSFTAHHTFGVLWLVREKIHPQPKLFARQNVKSGHVGYFQRAPGKANATYWKGFLLIYVQADRGNQSVPNWKQKHWFEAQHLNSCFSIKFVFITLLSHGTVVNGEASAARQCSQTT